MVQFKIRHVTTYRYDNYVQNIKNIIKLYPVEDSHQQLISQEIKVTANPYISVSHDGFGNKFGMFSLRGSFNELSIDSEVVVSTVERDVVADVCRTWQNWDDVNLLSIDNSFQVFLNQKDFIGIKEIISVVQSFNVRSKMPFQVIKEFNSYIYHNFHYNTGVTSVFTTLAQVWNMKAGVCQDFAHILIVMLRLINIPARYVSGYICPNKNGMRGDGASHAWVEAYLPYYGWLGVDPTNNCLVNEKHVRLAVGRDYNDISPVKGEFWGTANQYLTVAVTVSYEESEKVLATASDQN
ncbi:MAG TPA: transglutaminase family protein [Cytophagaceae bacterium]|jgi:transglutaminase-like putative cysteine protease